ncbi:MAG: polysaccharide biosynthesis tyrosine autokinase [Rubripirellula sp.]
MNLPQNDTVSTPIFELDLLGLFRRRFKHIVLGLFLGLIGALAYFYVTTPLYESRMEILVGQRSSEMTTRGTSNDAYGNGASVQDDVLATHIDILTSDRILEDAVIQGDLIAKIDRLGVAEQNGARVVSILKNNLEVKRGGHGSVKEANVISAIYIDEDADDAALILHAIYDAYKLYVKKHSQNDSEEAANLIKDAQVLQEAELGKADLAYRDFISSVPIFVEGNQIREMHRDRLARLESELNTVRGEIATTVAREEVIAAFMENKELEDVTDIEQLALLSEKEVQRLKFFMEVSRGESGRSQEFAASMPYRSQTASAQFNRLLDLYQRQRQLAEEFGPGHPSVQSVMQEIEVIEEFIAANSPKEIEDKEEKLMTAPEMLAAYRKMLKNDLAELTRRETVLRLTAAEELKLAKKVEADFMKGNSLKAKLDRAQQRYDEVFRRLQELDLAGNYAGFSTDLLAKPIPALAQSWPKLPLSMAVGLLLGGLLGLSTGVIAEFADSTFRDAKDLEAAVGSTILTHVGTFDMPKLREMVDPDSTLAPQLCTYHAPRSQEAEVYRTARTSLLLASKRQNRKAIMVTSPAPGDGKSTTISNLAISLAQAGKKVLLVDADLRRPMIQNLFGTDDHVGVADVVIGDMLLKDAVQSCDQENLTLLTHGTRTSAPSELFETFEFSQMLEQARRDYDIIFLDAPPVLAVTDPAIIASLADATLLTVQVTKNGRRPVERAVEILNDVGVELTGVIVNNSDLKVKGYGYSHDKYGYGYGYGSGEYYDEYMAADVPKKKGQPRRATAKSA